MVGVIGGIFLGAVLILATFGKMVEPIVFVEQIRSEGLDVFFSANQVALIALALEMGLGMALVLGDRSRWVLVPTALMVAFFLIVTWRTYWLVITGQVDNTYDCGCFGVFLQRTATEAFWQDLFLLVPPLIMCFVGRRQVSNGRPSWRFWVGSVSAVVVVLYTVIAIGMPHEDLVTNDQSSIVEEAETGAFSLVQQYSFWVDDKLDANAKIYQSEVSTQFIIFSSQFSYSLILDLERSRVLRVSSEALERKAGETLDVQLLSEAEDLGPFEVGLEGLSSTFEGRTIQLRSRE
jgi:hypothetical protein